MEIHPAVASSSSGGDRFVLVGTVDGSVVIYDAMYTKTGSAGSGRNGREPVFVSNKRFGRRGGEHGVGTSRVARTSRGHWKSVSSVAWYPEDANAFFSASFDGTVKLWDASRAEVEVTYASGAESGRDGRRSGALGGGGGGGGGSARIRDVSLSLSSHLNNDLVAIATDEPDVKLWDPGSNVVGMTLPKAHPGGCSKTAWSKENAFSVITCGFEGRCAVWDARRCATPLFSMDRRRSSSEVEVGRSTSWSSLRKPIEFYDENARAHADGIESVLIHPNGRSVFTKGFGFRNDARVREWDLRTGRCDATKFERFSKSSSSTTTQNARGVDAMNASAGGAAAQYRYSTTMSCTEDGVNIFAPSQDGSILVYDSRTGAISERLKCHADRVTSVQFAARECELFSASMDGFLVRWKSKGARASTRTTNTENRESERDWVSDDEEDDEDIGVGTHRNVRARR